MFKDLIGQELAVKLLEESLKKDRIAPAYIFTGVPGIGRSMAAKIFAELLLTKKISKERQELIKKKIQNHNHPDLLLVEPTYKNKGELISFSKAKAQGLKIKSPPKIRIEQIRQITQFIDRPPLESERSVIIIKDAEKMSEASANALLKTLEEPKQATLILIAPNKESLLSTIVSRCQNIPFCQLSQNNLQTVLKNIGDREILEHPEIINLAEGSPGKAIASWEKLQEIPTDLLSKVKRNSYNSIEVFELAKEISKQLDITTQLWLVDYLQYYFWQKNKNISLTEQWEKTRKYLLNYVQPRLVWECSLNRSTITN